MTPSDVREKESVHENCWHQGVQAGRNFGFFADGFYHNLVILKRRPQRTRRGSFWALTSLPFLDYTITVNLYPQNIRKEIDRTERSLERVRGDYLAERKHSLMAVISSDRFADEPAYHSGELIPITVRANTGIVVCYDIKHVLEEIEQNPNGAEIKKA
jgi:hypothetical protein